MSVPGAENPDKVKNIVRGPGNLQGFRELYGGLLKGHPELRFEDKEGEAGTEEGQGRMVVSDRRAQRAIADLFSSRTTWHIDQGCCQHFRLAYSRR